MSVRSQRASHRRELELLRKKLAAVARDVESFAKVLYIELGMGKDAEVEYQWLMDAVARLHSAKTDMVTALREEQP